MEKVDGLNKSFYKIVLYLLKIITYLIAFIYLLNTTLSYFCIDAPILSLLGGLSILPTIYILLTSFAFKFCIYHRIPLYYIILSDCIAYYDIYYSIPISASTLFSINLIIAGICLFIILYLKLNHETKLNKTNIKRP